MTHTDDGLWTLEQGRHFSVNERGRVYYSGDTTIETNIMAECDMMSIEALLDTPTIKYTKGTEPMNTTTTTEVTVTERTAKDIIKAVKDNVYTTKSKGLIVGHDWDGDIRVSANPLNNHCGNGKALLLSEETLHELSNLSVLLKADRDGERAEWKSEDATYRLNNAGK